MNVWREDLLTRLSAAHSATEVFSVIEREGKALGFDHLAYGVRFRYPLSNPRIVLLNNYPEQWQTLYAERGYVKIDPIVMRGMVSQIPIVWSEHYSRASNTFWEEARQFGIAHGWSQSATDCRGLQSLVSFVRGAEYLGSAELTANGARLSFLAHAGHEYMCHQLARDHHAQDSGELTTREIEVLRWTAEGKTAGEISILMGISDRTVNFHAANAMAKLNCANKTATAVKAAILGLLD
ncbi:autoinducer binding domain-containing protein [Nitrogeniibacter aestuarii]|uniref:autoinducer binding domain-containing protein n=1 Tax=Nitrogeniibacter aestuarii TaxID=2815343 RepID=UPI001D1227F5|nr:autoinducer binding domain-containing protein [Nitrogeniibacter aestuarii]